MRVCTKCQQAKPLNEDTYGNDRSGRWLTECRRCRGDLPTEPLRALIRKELAVLRDEWQGSSAATFVPRGFDELAKRWRGNTKPAKRVTAGLLERIERGELRWVSWEDADEVVTGAGWMLWELFSPGELQGSVFEDVEVAA